MPTGSSAPTTIAAPMPSRRIVALPGLAYFGAKAGTFVALDSAGSEHAIFNEQVVVLRGKVDADAPAHVRGLRRDEARVVSRRARADARHLGATLRHLDARRQRAEHLVGLAALRGPLTVADLAREIGRSPRTVRRYRDRAAQIVGTPPSAARGARADITRPDDRPDNDARQRALRAIRALSVAGRPPAVRTYRAAQRDYAAPSVEAVLALFGSWRAAVEAAGFEPRSVGRPRKARA